MTKPAKKPRGGQKKSLKAIWHTYGKAYRQRLDAHRGNREDNGVEVTNEKLMEDVGLVGEAVCLPCDGKHLYGSAYGEVIKFNRHDRSVTVEYWDQTIGTWSFAEHHADYVRDHLINPQKETFRGLSSNTDESLKTWTKSTDYPTDERLSGSWTSFQGRNPSCKHSKRCWKDTVGSSW